MKRKHPPPKPRSPAARALARPLYRQRKVKPLKGKGSYKRRPKHRGRRFSFVERFAFIAGIMQSRQVTLAIRTNLHDIAL